MALRHAKPEEVSDLRPLGDDLAAARTHAIVRTPSFEAVRLVVPATTEFPTHKVSGRIMLHCIEGHVQLGLVDTPVDLRAGDWVYRKGTSPTRCEAEGASLLLTILFDA